MHEPGTKITGAHTVTRTIAGVPVEETVITWNGTRSMSVDYRVGAIEMHADTVALTSFDEPLSDEELLDLLGTYSVLGLRVSPSHPSDVVEEMLEAAVGRLSRHDTEGIELVAAMLNAVLDDDARAARPAIDIVRARVRDAA